MVVVDVIGGIRSGHVGERGGVGGWEEKMDVGVDSYYATL
jgi:hypothetical protein